MRERISKNDYFMLQAIIVSLRSHDESTRHGCVVVAPDGKVLTQGYNGYPKGCPDHAMPTTRPDKYLCILHSEENAFLSCNESLEGCIMYVTGHPCVKCFAAIIQKGVSEVVYGPVQSTSRNSPHLEDSNSEIIDLMNQNRVQITQWKPDNLGLILDEISQLTSILRSA